MTLNDTARPAPAFVRPANYDTVSATPELAMSMNLARHIVVMQAACIEARHRGPEAAMAWILNTLCGPGLIPDAEPDAQAYFDLHAPSIDACAFVPSPAPEVSAGERALPEMPRPAVHAWADISEHFLREDHYTADQIRTLILADRTLAAQAAVQGWIRIEDSDLKHGERVMVLTTDADDEPHPTLAHFNGGTGFLGYNAHKVEPVTHYQRITAVPADWKLPSTPPRKPKGQQSKRPSPTAEKGEGK